VPHEICITTSLERIRPVNLTIIASIYLMVLSWNVSSSPL
jgi:hypothetical protein